MLELQTKIRVDGAAASEFFDFIANPDDESYRAWWPGTHLQLHIRERGSDDHVGDLIYMDEYVGTRRVRMIAIVLEAVRGKRLVWGMKRVVRLPVRLVLDFVDDAAGVEITHTIEAGFSGPGRVLDSVMKLYFTQAFTEALDDHVRTEFPLLRDRLGEIEAELPPR